MAIRLQDLLRRVPEGVKARVREARDRTRPVLQEALRAECRLVLRTPEEAQARRPGAQVPVDIDSGCPLALQGLEFPDEVELVMLLSRYRTALEQTGLGVSRLLTLRDELSANPGHHKWLPADGSALEATSAWVQALLKVLEQDDPVEAVLAVNQDALGVYEFKSGSLEGDDREVNPARIRLYWTVIGIVSEWLGCTVEDLTVVVLAHELSHAYTQLGADIEGRRWPAADFGMVELEVAEGLAQYYTERVLRRLDRRYPGALNAFEKMLPGQPEAYRAHQPWLQHSTPEAVRRTMLEVRRWREGTLAQFQNRLEEAQKQWEPDLPHEELRRRDGPIDDD